MSLSLFATITPVHGALWHLPDEIICLLLTNLNYIDLIVFTHAVRHNWRLYAFAIKMLTTKVQRYYPGHKLVFGLLAQMTINELEKLIMLRTYGQKCKKDLHKFPRVQTFLLGQENDKTNKI